jgi:hypothetical protein
VSVGSTGHHDRDRASTGGTHRRIEKKRCAGETNQQASAALKAPTRPYPYAVAGIPVSYSFDSTSREFTLSSTSYRTDGEPFPSGTDTEGITPKITYPDGYRVSADGATVASQRCAPC